MAQEKQKDISFNVSQKDYDKIKSLADKEGLRITAYCKRQVYLSMK